MTQILTDHYSGLENSTDDEVGRTISQVIRSIL